MCQLLLVANRGCLATSGARKVEGAQRVIETPPGAIPQKPAVPLRDVAKTGCVLRCEAQGKCLIAKMRRPSHLRFISLDKKIIGRLAVVHDAAPRAATSAMS